ncbi:MAG TPA: hypothetical protein VHL80_03215, partial [Polyangia bacterium]|nr:hypothetical protein [Polyangia bacterium]
GGPGADASPRDSSSGASGAGGTGGGSGGAADALAADAGVSLVTAQYRACVAYFRAECNREDVCEGGGEVADPCPTITDRCPDSEFAPGSLRTPESLLACAEAWRTLPCDMFASGQFPPCAGIAGSLPDGAPCSTAVQCAGRACGKGSDMQHPSCGACATRVVSGGGCGDGGACQYDEECINDACMKLVTGVALGQPCDDTHVCALPNLCVRTGSGIATTCQPQPKLGDACSGLIFCGDGSLCTAAGKCEAAPADGQPCKRDAAFDRYTCATADVCDEAAAGGPTCVVRPGMGVACTPSPGGELEQGSCASGLYCSCPIAGTGCTCVRRLQEGEACGAPGTLCVPGTSCVAGACQAVMLGTMAALCGP